MKILFIGGFSRSGSSMIERLLDQSPEFVSFGELHTLIARYDKRSQLDKRQYCGCGEEFQDCEFWSKVITHAFGSMDAYDPHALYERFRPFASPQHLKEMLKSQHDPEMAEKIKQAAADLKVIYTALSEVTGKTVLVDSSKVNEYAALALHMPDVDFRFLHLVRNPIGCAYSWRREKKRPEVHWEDRYMIKMSPALAARRWSARQLDALRIGKLLPEGKYMRFHYEDFVKDPEGSLKEIAEFCGVGAESIDGIFDDKGVAKVRQSHTIMGNPNRFQTEITVRADDAWKEKMSFLNKAIVALISAPVRFLVR